MCKRRNVLFLAGCMAVLLGGCADKKVDYDMDTQQAQKEAAGSLGQFASEEKWTDEWEVKTEDGEEITLLIDAEISVPNVDTMSVVEVENLTIDAAAKKQLLDAFFGGTDIYYYDVEHQTREELEELIEQKEAEKDNQEEAIESLKGLIEGEELSEMQNDLDEMKAELEELSAAKESAGSEYTVAGDYGSCTDFIAFLNDARYDISFLKEGKVPYISIQPGNMLEGESTYIPEALTDLKGKDQISCYYDTAEEDANTCPLSREEAQRIAEQFVQSSGGSNYVLEKTSDLMWWGRDQEESDAEAIRYAHGYVFIYGIGIDGYPFEEPEFDEWMYGDSELPMFASRMMLAVTEDGVITVDWDHPFTVKNVIRNVELLPIETVQNIMKNEVKEHTDQYVFELYKDFNAMDLVYFRVRDKAVEGSYSYIPVWRLSQKGSLCYHPIFVNAIDGNIIYLQDEVTDEGGPTRTDLVPKG